MKRIFSFSALILSMYFSYSQETCGTLITQEDINYRVDFQKAETRARSTQQTNERVNIPMTIHIVRRNDGSGGVSMEDLNSGIEETNIAFEPINFNFYIKSINYIENTELYDFDSSEEPQIIPANNVINTVNVYYFGSVSGACGYAYLPPVGRDYIVMNNSCAADKTLPHEFGHFFWLPHTHGPSNSTLTNELVNGSNCDTAGDAICDTPADPNLSGGSTNSSNCSYSGDQKDVNGDTFRPFVKNLMAYSSDACQNQFTSDQYELMKLGYTTYKQHIGETGKLSPEIYMNSRFVCINGEISFENVSLNNYTSMEWEFEGGTPAISNTAIQNVTYTTAGTYDVKLTLSNEGESEEIILSDYVIVEESTTFNDDLAIGSFEDAEIIEKLYNDDNELTFKKTTSGSTDGNSSIMIEFINYLTKGEQDYIVLANVNSTINKTFEVEFDYAYTQYGPSNDELAVVYRDNCGDWVTVSSKSGSELATATERRLNFVPNETEWNHDIVTVQIPDEINETEIALRVTNDFGNNLYIDNYEVQSDDPTFSVSDIVISNTTCNDSNDGSISIVINDSGTYEFALNDGEFSSSNSFENLASGSYEIFVKRSGSDVIKDESAIIDFVNVRPDKPEISLIGDFLQTSVGAGLTVQWYLDGEAIEGETAGSISNLVSGAYEVEVARGVCSAISDPFIVLSTDDISEGLQLYPNPANDVMYFSLTDRGSALVKVEIINSAGKLMHQTITNSVVDVSKLSSGIYFVRVVTNDKIYLERLIKK